MKRVVLTVLMCLLSLPVFSITGREIAENVDERDKGESSHSLAQMDLIDKSGEVSSRRIEEFSMDDKNDLGRVIMIFHAPASVKNTRFLVMEKDGDADDDQWIYLPAMQRVRRIAASEGSSSFMGSDFSYDDMSSRDIDDYSYELLGEEAFDGVDCYKVQVTPLDLEDDQYSKLITWVEKATWVNRKVEMYDKKGELEKVLTVERLEVVQGYQTPIITRMQNVQNGHSTLLSVKKFVYNDSFPESIFSTRFLQTGKP